MSEAGGQFAGASERSTKHSPRVDDELEHEMQGMLRGERANRAEEWREVEPQAEGDPDIDRVPDGTYTGGTPVGMTPDAVAARAELARWLDRADFPSTGPGLVEAAPGQPAPGAALLGAARAAGAPDAVVAELERLPEGDTYERVGDVVRALGYPTET